MFTTLSGRRTRAALTATVLAGGALLLAACSSSSSSPASSTAGSSSSASPAPAAAENFTMLLPWYADPEGGGFNCPLDAQRAAWPTEDYHLARSLVDTVGTEDDLFAGIRKRVAL